MLSIGRIVSRSIVITCVNLAVSVLLGVLVLHEALSIAIVVGFLLIIAVPWLSTAGSILFAFARKASKSGAARQA